MVDGGNELLQGVSRLEEDKVDVGRTIRRLQRWLMQEMTLVCTRIMKTGSNRVGSV